MIALRSVLSQTWVSIGRRREIPCDSRNLIRFRRLRAFAAIRSMAENTFMKMWAPVVPKKVQSRFRSRTITGGKIIFQSAPILLLTRESRTFGSRTKDNYLYESGHLWVHCPIWNKCSGCGVIAQRYVHVPRVSLLSMGKLWKEI